MEAVSKPPPVPSYSLAPRLPNPTFPLRAPRSTGVEPQSSSIISDDHTSISFNPSTTSHPLLPDLSEEPVTFECDTRPYLPHPTRPARTHQQPNHFTTPIFTSPQRPPLPTFSTALTHNRAASPDWRPHPSSNITSSRFPQSNLRNVPHLQRDPSSNVTPPQLPQAHIDSPPRLDLNHPSEVGSTSFSEDVFKTATQSRDSLSNPEPLPPNQMNDETAPSNVDPPMPVFGTEIEPLHPLTAKKFPQVHVDPIVPTKLEAIQTITKSSSRNSSARSSGTYPHLVIETPRTSSVRSSRDIQSEKRSSVRQSRRKSDAVNDKATEQGACGSFAYGTLLGLLPVLLAIRVALHYVRKEEAKSAWDERWLKYGVTFGLFLIVGIAIIVVIVNIS